VVFLFDIPLETCLARDQARERSVGQAVIERQYRLFVQESSHIERESFDEVIKLRPEDLAKLRVDVLFRPLPKPSVPLEPPPRRRAAFRTGARNERGYGAPRGLAPPAPETSRSRAAGGTGPSGWGPRQAAPPPGLEPPSPAGSVPAGSTSPPAQERPPSPPRPSAALEVHQERDDTLGPSKQ